MAALAPVVQFANQIGPMKEAWLFSKYMYVSNSFLTTILDRLEAYKAK